MFGTARGAGVPSCLVAGAAVAPSGVLGGSTGLETTARDMAWEVGSWTRSPNMFVHDIMALTLHFNLLVSVFKFLPSIEPPPFDQNEYVSSSESISALASQHLAAV